MHWAQALVFCGCLMGASIYDVRHRLVDDRVCVARVLAGVITISPASFLGALAGGLPFYLGRASGKTGPGIRCLRRQRGLCWAFPALSRGLRCSPFATPCLCWEKVLF